MGRHLLWPMFIGRHESVAHVSRPLSPLAQLIWQTQRPKATDDENVFLLFSIDYVGLSLMAAFSRFGRGIDGAEDRAQGKCWIRVPSKRASTARHVDNACCGRLAQQRQHCLGDGDDAEHVGLKHRPQFIEGHIAREGRLGELLHGHARQPSRM